MYRLPLIFALLSVQASAFSVSPMSIEYKLSSGETSQVYTVINTDDQPISIEIRVASRKYEPGGKEINESGDDVTKMFSIFPKAALIKPKQKKGIRVMYVGPKDITSERTYRIIIAQQPTKDTSNQLGMKMLQQFNTTAYITPKGSKPEVKLKRVEAAEEKIKFSFINSGSAHFLVKRMKIIVKDELGNQVRIDENKNEQLLVNFLAGEERTLEVLKPAALKGKNLSGAIELLEQ